MTIEFEGLRERREFRGPLHPETRGLVLELAAFSQGAGLPPPFVTMVLRTVDEQEDLYWEEILDSYQKKGLPMTVEQAHRLARQKFSWHIRGTGVDLRTHGPNAAFPHYTKEQLDRVVDWIRRRTVNPQSDAETRSERPWELITKLHGSGPHIHIARRDPAWKLEGSTT